MTKAMDHRAYGWSDAESNTSHRYLVPFVEQRLARFFAGRHGRVLDLGCGNGYVTGKIAARGHEVVGVEPSPDGLEHARRAHPNVRFEVGSVYDDALPAGVADMDAVVTLEVLEHLFYPRKLFETAFKALRPGGLLILSTPYHGYLKNLALAVAGAWDNHVNVGWDGGHIKFFSFKSAEKMAREAGFEQIELSGVGRVRYLWMSMFLVARKPMR